MFDTSLPDRHVKHPAHAAIETADAAQLVHAAATELSTRHPAASDRIDVRTIDHLIWRVESGRDIRWADDT